MKSCSCGILIFHNKKLLMCHSTGNRHWDIPKGLQEPGETHIQTAIRECREETGLILNPSELTDLGLFKYNSQKNLYLFSTRKEVQISELKCTSYFNLYDKLYPEVNDYQYFNKNEALQKASKVLSKVLSDLTFI